MISVCIASYNGEKYIKTQLDSILKQLSEDDEVIISDDGSTDNTVNIINSLNDNRITLFRNNFKNVIKNFEFVIQQSKGDFIFLSDQDDIWLDNKVSKCLEPLRAGNDLVLHNCNIFDSNTGYIIEPSFFDFNSSRKGFIKNIIKNSYIGCCMAFSSDLKEKILPFPKHIPMHDSWIGLNAELYKNIFFIPDVLVSYRKHNNNVSSTSKGKSPYSIPEKIIFRIKLFYSILARL